MYTEKNFKSKKALKDALKSGEKIYVYSPGPFPCPSEGRVFLEGPHYPAPHSWYAQGTLVNGVLVKVS